MTARRRRVPRTAVPLLVGAALAGCAAMGGIRPVFGPVPGSVSVILEAPPDAVTRAAAEEVQHAGLRLQWLSVEEGYVETLWYDLRSQTSSTEPHGDLEQTVKIRFFADPTAGKTRVVAECVITSLVDPSRSRRELERMAPEGHRGREVLQQVLDRLERRFPVRQVRGEP